MHIVFVSSFSVYWIIKDTSLQSLGEDDTPGPIDTALRETRAAWDR